MIVPQFCQHFPCIHAGFCDATESLTQNNLILMHQVHSADAITLLTPPQAPPPCDALVTTQKGLKLTVKTADCAPVLFADPQKQIIGATHAGWKGALQGVMENTVLAMLKLGAELENIHVTIGPHLTQKSFQVTSEMRALFPQTEHFLFTDTQTGIYFDFTGYLQHRLKRLGLTHIEIYPIDTFSNTAYNSYRRDAQNPARQYSFIELK